LARPRPRQPAQDRPARRSHLLPPLPQHVLPNRCVRIRRYGLLSNRVCKSLLERCRGFLGTEAPALPAVESRTAAALRIFGRDPELCPKCHQGRLVVRAEWRATRLPLDTIIAGLVPRAP
jgi:hypothetical protein